MSNERINTCRACEMLLAGVKSRIALRHTCDNREIKPEKSLNSYNVIDPIPLRYGIATDEMGYVSVFANHKGNGYWTVSLQSMSAVMLKDTGVFYDLACSSRGVTPECYSFETLELAVECFHKFYKK